jgi:hypothetical protein
VNSHSDMLLMAGNGDLTGDGATGGYDLDTAGSVRAAAAAAAAAAIRFIRGGADIIVISRSSVGCT